MNSEDLVKASGEDFGTELLKGLSAGLGADEVDAASILRDLVNRTSPGQDAWRALEAAQKSAEFIDVQAPPENHSECFKLVYKHRDIEGDIVGQALMGILTPTGDNGKWQRWDLFPGISFLTPAQYAAAITVPEVARRNSFEMLTIYPPGTSVLASDLDRGFLQRWATAVTYSNASPACLAFVASLLPKNSELKKHMNLKARTLDAKLPSKGGLAAKSDLLGQVLEQEPDEHGVIPAVIKYG